MRYRFLYWGISSDSLRRNEADAAGEIVMDLPKTITAGAAAKAIDKWGDGAIPRLLSRGAVLISSKGLPISIGHGVTAVYGESNPIRRRTYRHNRALAFRISKM